jgi:squalene-hopene/tetraprenyl-beta-curcumene cyclase
VTNATGEVVFRSYGSITYAGMLALVYAKVSRDDVRVRSAFDWAAKHWTLDENPGMGQEGLYFFFNVLSRCLSAYGQDMIPVPGGKFVDWRGALARKLITAQTVDPKTGGGFWVNPSGRYWENDPVLVTAYALLALQAL